MHSLLLTKKDQISARSFYIASYALAGFSNLSSIGIQLAGLTPLAPNQAKKLANVAFSDNMIAGNTTSFMTAPALLDSFTSRIARKKR